MIERPFVITRAVSEFDRVVDISFEKLSEFSQKLQLIEIGIDEMMNQKILLEA